MILSDEDEGIDFMGLVEHPAHMKSFIAFGKDGKPEKKQHFFNDDEQIIMGVAISTDQPIYRRSAEIGEYYTYFTKEETRKMGQRLLASGYLNNVNEQHDSSKVVEGIQLDSIYYVDKDRGIEAPAVFKDQKLKDGSMIISYKVHDKQNWNSIKQKIQSGEISGFSIEGWFDQHEVQIQKNNQKQNEMSKEEKSMVAKLYNKMFGKTKFEEAETVDGVIVFWEGELATGTQLFIKDEEGNELQAPEGSHSIMMEDGMSKVIVVDGTGVVTSVEDVEAEEESAEEKEAREAKELEEATQMKAINDKFEALTKENKDAKAKFDKVTADNAKLTSDLKAKDVDLEELTVKFQALEATKGRQDEERSKSYKSNLYNEDGTIKKK